MLVHSPDFASKLFYKFLMSLKMGPAWILFRLFWPFQKLLFKYWFQFFFPDWKSIRKKTENLPGFYDTFFPGYFCNQTGKIPGKPSPPQSHSIENLNDLTLSLFGWKDMPYHKDLWHKHPITQEQYPSACSSFSIPAFANGDIRFLWEVGRMGDLCGLIRSYFINKNDACCTLVVNYHKDFIQSNQPCKGPHWMCGQETSLRGFHWLCSLATFQNSAVYGEIRKQVIECLWFSGIRVEKTIGYALSQKNNHGISESAFLLVLGTVFPSWPQSRRWRKKGSKWLQKQIIDQFYQDGGYCQRSNAYHYLALSVCLLTISIVQSKTDNPFNDTVKKRILNSVHFLSSQINKVNGMVFKHGLDDGSSILQLHGCHYRDFRPVLQALHYHLTGKNLFESGDWDELGMTLLGWKAQSFPLCKTRPPPDSLYLKSSGYRILNTLSHQALFHFPRFYHRPAQSDLFHFNLRWRNEDIILDPGTFAYNGPDKWKNLFALGKFHNGPLLGNTELIKRTGHFSSYPWTNTRIIQKENPSTLPIRWTEVSIDKYPGLSSAVTLRRCVFEIGKKGFIIIDFWRHRYNINYRSYWLFPFRQFNWDQHTFRLQLSDSFYYANFNFFDCSRNRKTNPESRIYIGDDESGFGLIADHYHHKTSAIGLQYQACGNHMYMAAVFSPLNLSTNCYNTHLLVLEKNNELLRIDFDNHAGKNDTLVKNIITCQSSGVTND